MGYYDNAKHELAHHGVLGQKWGVRRFQNPDGSLTAEGKKRVYGGGAEGGYESTAHRTRRAIDAAKYDHDINKTEKKIDKAISKGNQKKADKLSEQLTKLNVNKSIMVKDLSPEEIKYGHDYLKTLNAVVIGDIVAGPVGGLIAGTAVSIKTGASETGKAVQRQGEERRKEFKKVEKLKKDAKKYDDDTDWDRWDESKSDAKWDKYYDAEWKLSNKTESRYKSAERGTPESAKNFDKYVDDHGGKLTWENFPSHDRDGAPTYNWTEKQKQKYIDEYNSKHH